jgi:LysM domain
MTRHMTRIEPIPSGAPTRSRLVQVRPAGCHGRPQPHGPRPSRPAGAPPRYRGTGVFTSTTSHRPRPVTPATTVALALLAALVTVGLGLVADFAEALRGGSDQAAGRMPDRFAVVRVETGETLQHLAARVAPDAPIGQVAQRIRELNGLDSSTVTTGQTLIAPAG